MLALVAAVLILAIGSVFGVMIPWRHGWPWHAVRLAIGIGLAVGLGGSYGLRRRRRRRK